MQPRRRLVIAQRPDALATRSVPSWCTLSYERVGLTDVRTSHSRASLNTEVPLGPLLTILRAVEMHSMGRLIIEADGTLLILARSPSSLIDSGVRLKEGQPGVHSHRLQVLIMPEQVLTQETSSGEMTLPDSTLLREPAIPQPVISVAANGMNELRQLLGRLGRQGLVTLTIKWHQSPQAPTRKLVDLCWSVDRLLMSTTITTPMVRPLTVADVVNENEDISVSVSMEQLQRALFHTSLLQTTTTVLAVIPEQILVISVSVGGHDPLVFDEHDGDEHRNRITYFVPAATA